MIFEVLNVDVIFLIVDKLSEPRDVWRFFLSCKTAREIMISGGIPKLDVIKKYKYESEHPVNIKRIETREEVIKQTKNIEAMMRAKIFLHYPEFYRRKSNWFIKWSGLNIYNKSLLYRDEYLRMFLFGWNKTSFSGRIILLELTAPFFIFMLVTKLKLKGKNNSKKLDEIQTFINENFDVDVPQLSLSCRQGLLRKKK